MLQTELLKILDDLIAIKEGKPSFANQGQSMNGYSQLYNYNALADKAKKLKEKFT